MKKTHVIWLITAIVIVVAIVTAILTATFSDVSSAEIEISDYRLCQDADGKDVVIIKYLLKNTGKEPTSLSWEGEYYVYQDGVELTEYELYDYEKKLPIECDYDSNDQYRNIKGGAEYYAEVAYLLEYPDRDIEVEVRDYGFPEKKTKIFKIK